MRAPAEHSLPHRFGYCGITVLFCAAKCAALLLPPDDGRGRGRIELQLKSRKESMKPVVRAAPVAAALGALSVVAVSSAAAQGAAPEADGLEAVVVTAV